MADQTPKWPRMVVRRLREGWTDQAIREHYPSPITTIRAARADLRVHARPSPDWDWRAAQLELDAGRSMREAAEAAGTTYQQVTRACYTGRLILPVREGVTAQTAGEMLDGGHSQREVAAVLGCSDAQVSRMLQRGQIVAPEYDARRREDARRRAEVDRRLQAGERACTVAGAVGVSRALVYDRAAALRKRGAL